MRTFRKIKRNRQVWLLLVLLLILPLHAAAEEDADKTAGSDALVAAECDDLTALVREQAARASKGTFTDGSQGADAPAVEIIPGGPEFTGVYGDHLTGMNAAMYAAVAARENDTDWASYDYVLAEGETREDAIDKICDPFFNVLWAYEYDHPEKTMGYGTGGRIYYEELDEQTVRFSAEYKTSPYSTEEVVSEGKAVIEEAMKEFSDTNRVLTLMEIHDWILDHATYDYAALEAAHSSEQFWYAHGPLGILLHETGVCESYAKLFKIFCDRMDIPCYMVISENHGWNYVYLADGEWYLLDSTWDDSLAEIDPNYQYAYFLLSNDPPLDETHTPVAVEALAVPKTAEDHFMFEDWQLKIPYAEGKAGEKAVWTYYPDNSLVISGEGAVDENFTLPDEICSGNVTFRGALRYVQIEEGITELGDGSFAGCTGMVSCTLPESLTVIGAHAFDGCSSMAFPELSGNLESLGDGAFRNCLLPETLTLPETLRYLGADALAGSGAAEIIFLGHVPEMTGPVFGDLKAIVKADCSWTDEYRMLAGPEMDWDVPGHTFGDAHKANEQTATAEKAGGYDMIRSCEVCGAEELTEHVTIPDAPELWPEETEGKLYIRWKPVDGAAKYEVYRAESENGPYTKIYTSTSSLSCTNTKNVVLGTTYYYKVRALGAQGMAGEFSEIVSRTAENARPTVTVSLTQEGLLKISWTKVAGAAKYEVYRAESENGPYTRIYTSTSGLSCTNTKNVTPGMMYYYKVRILDAEGKAGEFSEVVSGKTKAVCPAVTVSLTQDGLLKISWTKVAGAAKYEVYRAESANGPYTRIYTTSAGLSCTNTKNVAAGMTYYYKVRVLDAEGKAGEFSEVVSGKTKAVRPTVTVSLTQDGLLKISWTKVAGAAKYEVYRAESANGPYTKIYTSTTGLSCTNTKNVVSGMTYYYKVRILDAGGKAGEFSDVVSGKTGTVRPTVTVSRTSEGLLKVSWTKVSGAAKYEVYRAESADGPYTRIYTTSAGLSCTNTKNVAAGTTYYYKVRILDAEGKAGEFSDVMSGKA